MRFGRSKAAPSRTGIFGGRILRPSLLWLPLLMLLVATVSFITARTSSEARLHRVLELVSVENVLLEARSGVTRAYLDVSLAKPSTGAQVLSDALARLERSRIAIAQLRSGRGETLHVSGQPVRDAAMERSLTEVLQALESFEAPVRQTLKAQAAATPQSLLPDPLEMQLRYSSFEARIRSAHDDAMVLMGHYRVQDVWQGRGIFLLWSGTIALVTIVLVLVEKRRIDAEKELERSEARFRAAISASQVTLATVDHELRFNWVYNAHPSFPVSEAMGKRYWEVNPGEGGRQVENLITAARTSRKTQRAEVSIPMEREVRHYDLFLEPVEDEQSGFLGLVVAAVDITERKELEQRLTVLKEQAEAAARAKDLFLGMMSHEIRTPLNAIVGPVSLLEGSGSLDPKQRHLVEIMKNGAAILLRVVDDALDFARIESGRFSLTREVLSLRECVRSVVDIILPSARAKGLVLSCEFAEAVPERVLGDELRLKQILINLLNNALKFTKSGTVTIQVEGESEDELVRVGFRIADTGIGMKQEFLARIFEPFVQEDASLQRRFGGTGLGLAIVHRIVKAMGGAIQVSSEIGKGSVFLVVIPFSVPHEAHAGDVRSPEPR